MLTLLSAFSDDICAPRQPPFFSPRYPGHFFRLTSDTQSLLLQASDYGAIKNPSTISKLRTSNFGVVAAVVMVIAKVVEIR
jgi:hypothetical protein